MILPVSQFFAYLEVGEAGGYTFDMPDSSLWTLYERLRVAGAPLSMSKVSEGSASALVPRDDEWAVMFLPLPGSS